MLTSKRPVLWFTCFFLLSWQTLASTPRDPYQFFFEQNLGDLQEELAVAKDDGKKGMFVFFEMDECPFCHRMKRTVLNQPDIQDFFKQNFHSISVDVEGDVEIVDFVEPYHAKGIC